MPDGREKMGAKDGLPLFLFCHANGFCKEVWRPVVEELSKIARAPFRWIALDFSGHGDTAKAVKMGDKWADYAVHDIVTVLKEWQGDSSYVVGVGHSLGGASLLLTELQYKGAFDRCAFVLYRPNELMVKGVGRVSACSVHTSLFIQAPQDFVVLVSLFFMNSHASSNLHSES